LLNLELMDCKRIYGEIVFIAENDAPVVYQSPWFPVSSVTSNTVTLPHPLATACISNFTISYAETGINPQETWFLVDPSHYCAQHGVHVGAIHGGSIKITPTTFSIPLWEGGAVARYWSTETSWVVRKTGFYKVTLWK